MTVVVTPLTLDTAETLSHRHLRPGLARPGGHSGGQWALVAQGQWELLLGVGLSLTCGAVSLQALTWPHGQGRGRRGRALPGQGSRRTWAPAPGRLCGLLARGGDRSARGAARCSHRAEVARSQAEHRQEPPQSRSRNMVREGTGPVRGTGTSGEATGMGNRSRGHLASRQAELHLQSHPCPVSDWPAGTLPRRAGRVGAFTPQTRKASM